MNSAPPSRPASLEVTFEQWVAMLCDPVMAAFAVFGIRLDVFQAARLRYYWWSQNTDDSSGVGSGKTIALFLFVNLRNILLPDHKTAIYYPTFGTGKNEFWTYFAQFVNPASTYYAPVFVSQLGNPLKVDAGDEIAGDGTTHGPDCFKAFYRNGNILMMPATNAVKNMVTSASLSFNTLVLEECRELDAMSDGINKILLDRARRYCWNQFHPVWGNHIVFSGHAEALMHPSAPRHKFHLKKEAMGDPRFANISYNFKDYSNLPCGARGETYKEKFRSQLATDVGSGSSSGAEWLGRGLGIWGANGTGWITEEAILRAQEAGRRCGLIPCISRQQFVESLTTDGHG